MSKNHASLGKLDLASESAYSAVMSSSIFDLDLPVGWECYVTLTQNADDAFVGKAELRQGGEARCVFVIAQQESRETARARLQFRVNHFIQEWESRLASEHSN